MFLEVNVAANELLLSDFMNSFVSGFSPTKELSSFNVKKSLVIKTASQPFSFCLLEY